MSFFGVGPGEMMLILVAALIIFGPRKLPEMAGQIGRMIGEFRRATDDLTKDFRDLNLNELTKPLPPQPASTALPAAPAVTVAAVTPPEGMTSPVEVREDETSTDDLEADAAVVDLLVEEEESSTAVAQEVTPATVQLEVAPTVVQAEEVPTANGLVSTVTEVLSPGPWVAHVATENEDDNSVTAGEAPEAAQPVAEATPTKVITLEEAQTENSLEAEAPKGAGI